MKLNVRPFEKKDISLLVDYWVNSSDDHLQSMGVDITKLPDKVILKESLLNAIQSKKSYCIIWECNAIPVGHTNVNKIIEGQQANMHLHLWDRNNRQKGLGVKFLQKSLILYFKTLDIQTLLCEPYAKNPAPNMALKSLGFEFVKNYKTVPGSINFEQDVNQWRLTRHQFEKLYLTK